MRIWTVVVGEPSEVDGNAVRLHRKCLLGRHLHKRGHDVVVFNGTVQHSAKRQRFEESTIVKGDDGITRAYLYGRIYKRNISPARIMNNRDVAASFLQLADKLDKPDVIVCSYPPIELAAAVRDYAAKNDIPFVVDLRDMWPDIIADVAPAPFRPLAKLVMHGWFASARETCRKAAGVVGISKPFLDWGLEMAARPKTANDRIFHLAVDPEAPKPEDIAAAETFWDGQGITVDKTVFAFSGTYSTRLDLMTAIEGAKRLPENIRDKVRFVFCGKGEAEDEMKQRAAGAPHILMAGWRNMAELHVLCRRSCAGLLPYPSTKDFTISFPNKVGEYFSAGLPIVTCLGGEMTRLIETEHCGLVYKQGDAASFAAAIETLLTRPDELRAQAASASRIYAREFDAQKIYDDYADYVEALGKKAG